VEWRLAEEREFGCGGGYSPPQKKDLTGGSQKLKDIIYGSRDKLNAAYLSTFGQAY
jgi:hypothetical protein